MAKGPPLSWLKIQQGCLVWQHHQAEIIWTLLIVVAALAILAKKVALPYPVLLALGGLVLGFVPGICFVETGKLFCAICGRYFAPSGDA